MPNYAISDGLKIINVIIAESQEIAQEITGSFAVEVIDGTPWIDWTLEEEGWRSPKPYESWNWDGFNWQPPISIPTLGGYIYTWNEDLGNWDSEEIMQPFPSWIRDENNNWIPPVPYPSDDNIYVWDEDLQNWKVVGE